MLSHLRATNSLGLAWLLWTQTSSRTAVNSAGEACTSLSVVSSGSPQRLAVLAAALLTIERTTLLHVSDPGGGVGRIARWVPRLLHAPSGFRTWLTTRRGPMGSSHLAGSTTALAALSAASAPPASKARCWIWIVQRRYHAPTTAQPAVANASAYSVEAEAQLVGTGGDVLRGDQGLASGLSRHTMRKPQADSGRWSPKAS